MTGPTPSNTLTLAVQPIGSAYPTIVDQSLQTALAKAAAGGSGTQDYFDAQNQTSDFWGMLATGEITFSAGVDPQHRPVLMASSGNVDLRVQAVPTGNPDGPVGIVTITSIVKNTGIQRVLTGNVVVQDNPSTLRVDADIFTQLLPALYESTGAMLVKLAGSFAEASQVEAPDVDSESLAISALFWASKKVMGLSDTFAKWALDYTVVTWGEAALEVAGVGVLIAIPMIVEFLGHRMRHSVLVQNLTGTAIGWQQWTCNGESVVTQAGTSLPALATRPDPLKPSVQQTLSSGINLQYLNTTDWGSIGYVLSLVPDGGAPQARVLFDIPWAGDNVIWAGASGDDAQSVWNAHANTADPVTSTSAVFGDLRVTVSINQLSGETDAAYFYCSTVVIEPR